MEDSRREEERREAKSLLVMRLAFAPLIIIYLMVIFEGGIDNPGVRVGLTLGVPIVFLGFALAFTRARTLKRLESREALGRHISTTRLMRFRWVCVEYAIARDVARGTYRDERPWEYRHEGDALTQRFIDRTVATQRNVIISLGLLLLAMLAVLVWVNARSPFPDGLALPALALVLFGGAFAAYVVMLGRGSQAERELARRIESTIVMAPEERWAVLLDVAHDELAQLPHS